MATLKVAEDGKIEVEEYGKHTFGGLVALVKSSFIALRDWMAMNFIEHIYGEWLVPHTIKYPDHCWNRFYVYDLLVEHASGEGSVFLDPHGTISPADFGFFPVERMVVLPSEPLTHARLRELTLQMQADLGFRIEGAILKAYELDIMGATDRFGKRFVYKDVLPEFHEVKGSDKAASAELPVDQRLAAALPQRTIEKRYLDVVAQNGGEFEGKLIPQIIGRVWNDFVTEIFAGALQDLKYPVVNTKEVKRIVDQRARQFALEYRAA